LKSPEDQGLMSKIEREKSQGVDERGGPLLGGVRRKMLLKLSGGTTGKGTISQRQTLNETAEKKVLADQW